MVDSENLCRRAMEIYGFPAQAAMVVEECSELTNAICKFRRGRVGEVRKERELDTSFRL